MPFKSLPSGFGPSQAVLRPESQPEYGPNLPEPLLVAILDSGLEREGRTTAVLARSFLYDHPASGARIIAPEGYVTDFASIPAAAQIVISPFGRHAKAAVLHDWLYAIGELDRKWFADQVFRDAMIELEVAPARVEIMYQAVHLFGGGGYGHADRAWATSWADWRTGDRQDPATLREEHYGARWPRPPRPDYGPE